MAAAMSTLWKMLVFLRFMTIMPPRIVNYIQEAHGVLLVRQRNTYPKLMRAKVGCSGWNQ